MISPAVLNACARGPLKSETDRQFAQRIAALAVAETARECIEIATEIDDKDGFRSGTGERIAALIATATVSRGDAMIPPTVQVEIANVDSPIRRTDLERIAALAVRETARECAELCKARFDLINNDFSGDTDYYYLDELQHLEEAIRTRYGIKETP